MNKFLRSLTLYARHFGILINPPKRAALPHCFNISGLLLHLCDYDVDLQRWVLRWIAYPLRHPGAKMATAIFVNGSEGAGKRLFFERILSEVHGRAGKRVGGHEIDESATYSSWAEGAHYVAIRTAYSPRVVERVKNLVCSSSLLIRQYGATIRSVPNEMNVVVITQGNDFLPLAANTRHLITIETPPPHGPAFYAAVLAEIQNGGIDKFRDYLLHDLDMTGFTPSTQPPGAATAIKQTGARMQSHGQAA